MTEQHPPECGTEAAEERAAIVEWLLEAGRATQFVDALMCRAVDGSRTDSAVEMIGVARSLLVDAAVAIERGEHQPRPTPSDKES